MKIAFIGQKGIPVSQGGIERHVEELAKRVALRGHQALVYSRSTYVTGDSVLPEGIEVVTLPSIPLKAWDSIVHTFLATIHVLFRKVDVVHYHHMGPAFFIGLLRLLRPSVAIVFTHHCDGTALPYWGRMAKLSMRAGEWMGMKFADQVISLSPVMTESLSQRYQREVLTIPNGISSFAQETGHQELVLPEKYILTTSRLIRAKGLDHLINAFHLIADDYSDYHLVIVGGSTHTDPHEPERLKKMASYNDRIHFMGQQPSSVLGLIYSKAIMFVQPSEVEGLPMTLLEATASGIPVIASNIPEHMAVLKSEGVSFKSKNPIDLAARMRHVLNNLPVEQVKSLALAKRVNTEYDWNFIVDRIEKVYATVAQKPTLETNLSDSKMSKRKKLLEIGSVFRSLF